MRVRVGLVSILICFASAAAYADGYVASKQPVALTVSSWTGLYGGLNFGGVQVDDGPMTSAPAMPPRRLSGQGVLQSAPALAIEPLMKTRGLSAEPNSDIMSSSRVS